MVEGRKQAVSIRMNSADLRKVKRLASRLGTRDSDVIRFAVKTMLAKLVPLYDGDVRGRNLVPVFVESGSELLRFFDLDAVRLESIINDGVDASRCVAPDDIALIAMRGAAEPYAALKLTQLKAASGTPPGDGAPSLEALRHYLYDKYLFQNSGRGNGGQDAVRTQDPPQKDQEAQNV